MFDLRELALLNPPQSLTALLSMLALLVPLRGPAETLMLDWNKYRPLVLAAAGTEKVIRVWDCRMLKVSGAGPGTGPESTLIGGVCEKNLLAHEYAMRKVQLSPHRADVLASASYDMTCRMCAFFYISPLAVMRMLTGERI